jgi:branched-chain amino acid aminotransferase
VSQGALTGVTRSTIIDIARSLGIAEREADLTRYDLWCADECFLTGSGAEVIPVVKLDGRTIGTGKPGPVTRTMMAEFKKRVLIEGTRI